MLDGVEKETLEKWAKECNEKYHKLFIKLFKSLCWARLERTNR